MSFSELELKRIGCEKLGGYNALYRVRVGDQRIVYGVQGRLVLIA